MSGSSGDESDVGVADWDDDVESLEPRRASVRNVSYVEPDSDEEDDEDDFVKPRPRKPFNGLVVLKIGSRAARQIQRAEENGVTFGYELPEDGPEFGSLSDANGNGNGVFGASESNNYEDRGGGDDVDDDDDESEEDMVVGRRRIGGKSAGKSSQKIPRKSGRNDDEDEYREEEDDEELSGSDAGSSEELERVSDTGFVVDSDDNPVSRSSRRSRQRRKRRSGRSGATSRTRPRPRRRLRRANSDSDEGDDDEDEVAGDEDDILSLKEELRELRGDPTPSPPPRRVHLRERKQVNYQIPPAFGDDAAAASAATGQQLPAGGPSSAINSIPPLPPKPRGGARGGGAGPIRRLFPTTGPFGGSDVFAVFQRRELRSKRATVDGVGAGQESDSEIDEPVTKPGSNNLPVGGAGELGDVTAGGSVVNKQALVADTDPLGVDMNIDFSAVGGLDDYINKLKEMVSLPLQYPEVYQKFGVTPPRGVLFHGPPGTGKTLMARALAASCTHNGKKITFYMRKGADCLSKWVGEAERQLRLLFEEAKNNQPSIIFFDEIDGLAPVRSSKQEQIHASIVSTLLALMDGMDNRGQVIVIGATNRPDSVDPALRRPGRFDREFYFPLPDLEARKKIISIHTRKWEPRLEERFLHHIADLSKGYGGADLRALCTEAALNAIQRRYPQIYTSQDKLLIDPSSIHVQTSDFMRAMDKIVPSSARSTSSAASPLPPHVEPLLRETMKAINTKLDHLLPRRKLLTALEEAMYEDAPPSGDSGESDFARQESLRAFQSARVYRPRLLICGDEGMGQEYVGAAVLHHLEGFHVQSFDLGTLFSDSTRTPEAALVQLMVEAKRHTPSVIYIPNLETWYETISDAAKSTFSGILRSLKPTDSVLVVGLCEARYSDLSPGLLKLFGYSSESFQELSPKDLGKRQRSEFFATLVDYIRSKPSRFPDPETRPKRKLEELPLAPVQPVAPTAASTAASGAAKMSSKQQRKKDLQLKNQLKVKLSPIMDMFKNRYKRMKKPPVDDIYLVHLFETPIEGVTMEHPYVKTDDDMILEVASGKKYYNMDLDVIEERLWNGYYSEPRQFLGDVELLYLDSQTLGDRDRLMRASEMFAYAQVQIDEINDVEFLKACRDLHKRELALEREKLEEQKRQQDEQEQNPPPQIEFQATVDTDVVVENGVMEVSRVENADVSMQDASAPNAPAGESEDTGVPSHDAGVGPVSNGILQAIDDADAIIPKRTVDESGTGASTTDGATKPPVPELENGHKPELDSSTSAADKMDEDPIESPRKMPEATVDAPIETAVETPVAAPVQAPVEATVEATSEPPVDVPPDAPVTPVEAPVAPAEPVSPPEPEPEFILNESKVEEFTSKLIDETAGFTVEELEQINSALVDTMWQHRAEWDRTSVLATLTEQLASTARQILRARE